MSRLRRFEIVEHQLYPYFPKPTSIFGSLPSLKLNPWLPTPEEDIDLLSVAPTSPLYLDDFDAVADLIQIHRASTRRRAARSREIYLQTLCDRVSALELGFERLSKKEEGDRTYTWTAEIKSHDEERKYKWTAEKKGLGKSYKLTTEIKKGATEQTYTIKVTNGEEKADKKNKKCEKVKEKCKPVGPRFVEIEEPSDHGGIVLRQCAETLISSPRVAYKHHRREFTYIVNDT